jgi:hypothetical protein
MEEKSRAAREVVGRGMLLLPLLSNLARVRRLRKERWRAVSWLAFVVVEEMCLPEESPV